VGTAALSPGSRISGSFKSALRSHPALCEVILCGGIAVELRRMNLIFTIFW
jgi:hypothetical protein